MKRRPRNAGPRRRTGTAGARSATGVFLHEFYAGMALTGILAAQATDPDTAWLRRRSFRIGCDMAEEAVRLRRKQPK